MFLATINNQRQFIFETPSEYLNFIRIGIKVAKDIEPEEVTFYEDDIQQTTGEVLLAMDEEKDNISVIFDDKIGTLVNIAHKTTEYDKKEPLTNEMLEKYYYGECNPGECFSDD